MKNRLFQNRPKESDPQSLQFNSVGPNTIVVGYSSWNQGLVLKLVDGCSARKGIIPGSFTILSDGDLSARHAALSEVVGYTMNKDTLYEQMDVDSSMILLAKCFLPLSALSEEERKLISID